jgi:hypothetical protein
MELRVGKISESVCPGQGFSGASNVKKNYGFKMYRFFSKLVNFSNPVQGTENRKAILAYDEIIHSESAPAV